MDINAINERNARVEADKAWETSWTRRLVLTAGIYVIAVIYFIFLGVNNAVLQALIPAVGYFASTLTLPFFKNLWLEKIYKRETSL
jgi:hypothetical protein